MRWLQKEKKCPPALGDKRRVTRFAWWITSVEGYNVWLESYYVTEELQEVLSFDSMEYGGMPLASLKWVEVGKSIRRVF